MIHNVKTGKPRGYAFIEYEHERDMHCEYLCHPYHKYTSVWSGCLYVYLF